jgi:hypothetical protein
MKSLAALLVGLRQLFSWRGTPRPSPRSLHDFSHRAAHDCPDHCDSKSNHNDAESLNGEQTEKFADLQHFLAQYEITGWTPLSDADLKTHSNGVSEVYSYHRLQDGSVALGLISWHRKDRAFEYVKQMIILVDIETDEPICEIEGPAEQIKPILVKPISFLKKS